MENIRPELFKQYKYWMGKIGDDEYQSPHTIGIHDVLRAHYLIADYFIDENHDDPIGLVGPKNLHMLHSALSRQFVEFQGVKKWNDPLDIAATLFFGLVKDHPFHDGNKRTAFLTALYHLLKIGRTPEATKKGQLPRKEFEQLTVRVARSGLHEYPRFADFRTKDESIVLFISDFFRRNTRKQDKKSYVITYRQLEAILKKHNFYLENPAGNKIDIVKYEKRKKLFGGTVTKTVRIGQIGFPGAKKEVPHKEINNVRKYTGLTPENGFDSKVFFHDADPLEALIPIYNGPLRRLADR